ncbi:hypothetical protein EDB81DRAFT_792327 [Dactylonectria macrodidyma]|uniref:Malate dehydrogenase n=1 Tax=Dactylonectria macrodidyma TaxID=307937 RepID=A0A9P9EV61_9HYPO|nr:hypothetical protein EDB81DRAFT_792327 [Dactylonectria macrodidyma]
MLYDAVHLYPGQSRKALTADGWLKLTSKVLNGHKVPLNLKTDGSVGASATKPFPKNAPLKIDGVAAMPFLGHHYFNAAGVPVFDLSVSSDLLIAKKLDAIAAPASADPGPDGTGAVAWLQLGDAGGSKGVSYVYRVLTAGGNSHGCTKAGDDSTSYTTMYWFYG